MMLALFILFTLLLLVWLASARGVAHETQHDADIAALIAQHDAQQPDNAQAQAEAEYRLYHDIRHIQQTAKAQHTLPWWILPLAALIFALAGALWYAPLGGYLTLHWHNLQQQLDSALTRSLYLGDLPQNISDSGMHTYCQSLQTRIDRTDPEQLDTLGACYSQYSNHAAALDVYRRLLRLSPDDSRAALNYAQAALFANPDQRMAQDVEHILVRLYADQPDDTLTGILLATAYTRAGEDDKALPVWQNLKRRTSPEHSFYTMIERSEAQIASRLAQKNASDDSAENSGAADAAPGSNTIRITIPPALLASLPEGTQLFVMLAGKDSPMPLAVQKMPPRDTQSITFSNADSMTGAEFLNRDDLILRAFLSADGSVSGERLGEIRENFPPGSTLNLAFPAP